jgi:hypothetical protein
MDGTQTLSPMWLQSYYIATFIIAFVALFAILLSLRTSRRTSSTLKAVEEGFQSLTTPLVKFKDYEWFNGEKDAPLSCANPPIGILITYQNFSNVAIQIHQQFLHVFYGNSQLGTNVPRLGSEETSAILAAGQALQSAIIEKDQFQRHLRISKPRLHPPHVRIDIHILFSRLNDPRKFNYKGEIEVHFDCADTSLKSYRMVSEAFT